MWVYRGVHARHKMLSQALQVVVAPGDLDSDMTAEEHNLLDESSASCFTSWTYSLQIARRFGRRHGPGGVVLRLPKDEAATTDGWSWHTSPDIHKEREVLLCGVRLDAEVLEHV